MKIVVLDRPRENPGELCWDGLKQFGEVDLYERCSADEVVSRIGDAEIVLLNKAPVTAEVLDACRNIRYIGVIGTGYNMVDVKAAAERGIPVTNVPSYGSEAIGQHAIALLLEITDHVAHHDSEVRKLRRSGPLDWCFWDYPSIELAHKTMGIIGLGRIAHTTVMTAKGLGMDVVAYTPHPKAEYDGIVEFVGLDELYAKSDVICLHCPLFDNNYHMINRDSIAKMKDGAILINNSRGALVDEEALAEALTSGKLYGAGLDTVEHEPIAGDNPLLKAPNVFFTPHISWAALECRTRLKDYVIENLKLFLEGNPKNVVNGL